MRNASGSGPLHRPERGHFLKRRLGLGACQPGRFPLSITIPRAVFAWAEGVKYLKDIVDAQGKYWPPSLVQRTLAEE